MNNPEGVALRTVAGPKLPSKDDHGTCAREDTMAGARGTPGRADESHAAASGSCNAEIVEMGRGAALRVMNRESLDAGDAMMRKERMGALGESGGSSV